jgi:hypothetical protein
MIKTMMMLIILPLLALLSACRMVPEGEAAAKRETAGGVSVVAVQYVVAALWPFSNFTDLSHFMV